MPNQEMTRYVLSYNEFCKQYRKRKKKGKVCKNTCSGAHECMKYNCYVHLICGKPIGDEGYGQSVIFVKRYLTIFNLVPGGFSLFDMN